MPDTLLDCLLTRLPAAKRQTLKRMVQAGRVRVNGQTARRLNIPVAADAVVEILDIKSSPRAVANRPGAPPFVIVHEDDDVLVVDKPAGMLTSTVPGERRPTLLAAVRAYVAGSRRPIPVGLIHRLDRDASGLLVFSKSDLAYRALKAQLLRHTVTRQYMAVVHGTPKPPQGRIESRLSERIDGSVHSVRGEGKGQHAVTNYETVRSENGMSLLRVTLQTGRKHQIRVHLRDRGTPIVGDSVYGSAPARGKPGSSRLNLAATTLGFTHPRSEQKMVFTIPAPSDFALSK